MKRDISIVLQAFKSGTKTVLGSNAQIIFLLLGLATFTIGFTKKYAMLGGIIIYTKLTGKPWDQYPHGITSMLLDFLLVAIQTILFFATIKITLMILERGNFQLADCKKHFQTKSKTNIILFTLKAIFLNQLIILLPGIIYTGLKLFIPAHPHVHLAIFIILLTISATFLNFSCWILTDTNASFITAIKNSITCSSKNITPLLLFHFISIIGLTYSKKISALSLIFYVIIYPIIIAAQGYLYKQFCSANNSGGWFKMPFNRPPVS